MGSALVRRGRESSEGKTGQDSRPRADDNTLLGRDRITASTDHASVKPRLVISLPVLDKGTAGMSDLQGTGTPISQTSQDKLPQVDSDEAPSTAASNILNWYSRIELRRLRLLLSQLERGDLPSISDLKKTISYAADVLSSQSWEDGPTQKSSSVEDKLQAVKEEQVRAWLASTFTRRESVYEQHPSFRLPTFKAVVQAVMIGRHIDNMYREGTVSTVPQYPPGITQVFEEQMNTCKFDIFKVESLTDSQPLLFVGRELFQRYDLMTKFKISPSCLDAFLSKLEEGYKHHGNSYHNATHGADVLQTVHYLIHVTGLESWLTQLELLALLLAAAIHDVDHTGTTNTFHVQSYSEFALLYNDRSVLENHHLHYAFTLLKENNILKELEEEEFCLLRGLVIDMVLATDMSGHFEKLKQMRVLMSAQHAASQMSDEEHRSKILCLLLHMADISHPCKPWILHHRWTSRLLEEFFQQGDREREAGRECSPLCDRNNTLVPESQIGFIDFIVSPSFEVCGDMLSMLTSCRSPPPEHQQPAIRLWAENLSDNRRKWKAQCREDDSRCTCSQNKDRPSSSESNHDNEPRTSSERVKQKKQSTVEMHTISTVETCLTPGGSETKTIRTMETCTVITDEATTISKDSSGGYRKQAYMNGNGANP